MASLAGYGNAAAMQYDGKEEHKQGGSESQTIKEDLGFNWRMIRVASRREAQER